MIPLPGELVSGHIDKQSEAVQVFADNRDLQIQGPTGGEGCLCLLILPLRS